ncbi:hypothetical protein P12x_006180 (plasmid) [Tundrisphaera lichenicola]|uniref:hypothetical protein n=1 Tax=Tundrisphaera lichenicola TaxID=2029860 RepID=UPI003EB72F2A
MKDLTRRTTSLIAWPLAALVLGLWVDVNGPSHADVSAARRRDHHHIDRERHRQELAAHERRSDRLIRLITSDDPARFLCLATRAQEGEGALAREVAEYQRGDRKVVVTTFEQSDPVRKVVDLTSGWGRTVVADLVEGSSSRIVVRIVPNGGGPEADGPVADGPAPSLVIATPRSGARAAPESGDRAAPAGDRDPFLGATVLRRSDRGSDLLAPGTLEDIDRSVGLSRQLSAATEHLGGGPLDRSAPIGPLDTEFGADFRMAVETHDALAAVIGVTKGLRSSPPDVTAISDALTRLRERPGQAKLADRLRLDLAVRAVLEGHPREARQLLPAREDPGADPEHAAAVLRDMQVLIAGAGEPVTWPSQEVARLGPSPAARGPRGPPVAGLGLLLPDASDSTWISPPEYATVGLPPLPRPAPPPLAQEQDRVRSFLIESLPGARSQVRHYLWHHHGRLRLPACDGHEDILGLVERELGRSARMIEAIGAEELMSPSLRGMPSWYPQLFASYLRSVLSAEECDLVRSLHGAEVPLLGIVDWVTSERCRELSRLLPQLADASKFRGYASLPDLGLELPELIERLPADELDVLHRFVWPDDSSTDEGSDVLEPGHAREDRTEPDRAASERLLRALRNPSILDKELFPPENPEFWEPSLRNVSTMLRAIDGDEGLPDGDRWTEPLLKLIGKRGAAGSSSDPAGND